MPRFTCFWPLSTKVKDVCHHTWLSSMCFYFIYCVCDIEKNIISWFVTFWESLSLFCTFPLQIVIIINFVVFLISCLLRFKKDYFHLWVGKENIHFILKFQVIGNHWGMWGQDYKQTGNKKLYFLCLSILSHWTLL